MMPNPKRFNAMQHCRRYRARLAVCLTQMHGAVRRREHGLAAEHADAAVECAMVAAHWARLWTMEEGGTVMALDVLQNVLDDLEEYLDNRADAEGNGPADYKPNEEMRLLNRLREAREGTGI